MSEPTVLPMFPLGSVLLPGAELALHVFEDRYRTMIEECVASGSDFGVTLIERGSEVGGGDARFDVGCAAQLVAAGRLDDGRWAVVAVGTQRVRVRRWLSDDPYPRAEVEFWLDIPAEGDLDRVGVEAELRRVLALAAEMGDAVADATVALADDVVTASYQMAALAPVGPLDQLALLAAAGPAERLSLLARLLAEESAVLARRLAGG